MNTSFSFNALAAVFVGATLMGAGCITVTGSKDRAATTTDGSFFATTDHGATWARKTVRPTADGLASINGANISRIAQSPSFPEILYAGTSNAGLLLSFDRAETWQTVSGVSGAVSAIALHPTDKCVSFIGSGTRVLRSTDCSITYEATYVDPRAKATVTSLAIPAASPRTIYVGNAQGDLLRSTDEGATWSAIHRFDDGIVKVLPSRQDGRTLWVITDGGLERSTDGGTTWTDLVRSLEEYDGARQPSELLEDPAAAGTLIHASRYGLLRSTDAGTTWTPMNTVTPPETTTITGLAVNPADSRELMYAVGTTLYLSRDGGLSWSTRRAPGLRTVTAIHFDAETSGTAYLGLTQPK